MYIANIGKGNNLLRATLNLKAAAWINLKFKFEKEAIATRAQ